MAAVSFQSVAEMFLHRVASTPDADAFYSPDGEKWSTSTWSDVGDRARNIAGGLMAMELTLENRCAILSGTRVEWIFADLGILCAGGATTTIYPSSTPEECAFILADSGTVFAFAEDDAQVDKLLSVREKVPQLRGIITIDGRARGDDFVLTLAQLEERGRQWHRDNPGAYETRTRAIRSDHLATLIYTSGTTGQPKGVELTHDCWVFEAEAMDALGFLSPADKQYLWLPLSHSFGKVLQVAIIRIGIPTAVDGRIDRLFENLKVVQPTFIAAVPRVFEKVYNQIVSGAKEKGGVGYRAFRWAMDVGAEVSALRQLGSNPTGTLAVKHALADRLVFAKFKDHFGGKVRFFLSGSAPLSYDIAVFFHAADILILEGYGLTESSAASFVNRPDRYRFGTVGTPLPGVEVKLSQDDDEILLRGRGIMRGYTNLPQVTAETLSEDGWLSTGDIGTIDADGFLKIVDRKKDLIKTSGGKYVAPQKLEGRLKALCPYISQILVHGDKRNFCTALISLAEEDIRKWAESVGLAHLSYSELAGHAHIRALIKPYIEQLNGELARHESIKDFALLPADLTVETGELTPSLKVKRKVVEAKYQDTLDSFYNDEIEAL
ncbi:MAG: long-chain acyl-CoA synthetase [Myxococcota bacterium]